MSRRRLSSGLVAFAVVLSFLALAGALSSRAHAVENGREVGDELVPDWATNLRVQHAGYQEDCTGTVVSRFYVLTAAHCVMNFIPEAPVKFVKNPESFGLSASKIRPRKLLLRTGRGHTRRAISTEPHPRFGLRGKFEGDARATFPCKADRYAGYTCRKANYTYSPYDAALIQLEEPLPVGTQSVRLAAERPRTGSDIRFVGYGGSRQLRITRPKSYRVSAKTCSPELFCADRLGDSSRTQDGDSGGPWFQGAFPNNVLQYGVHGGGAEDPDAYAVSIAALQPWLGKTAKLSSTATDADSVGMALSIDSSGSMSSNDPDRRRVAAAESYLVSAGGSDAVGVVDFDDGARIVSPARNPRAEKDALVSAIRTIDASGGTNIGAGVAQACEVLKSSGAQRNKAAILLTDGDGSYSGENSCFRDNGWKLFTFGLGNSVNDGLLSQIATETGGRYRPLPTTGDLVCEFQQVRALAAGGSARDCSPTGTITPGQRKQQTIHVAPNLLQAVFSVSWPGSDVDLELVSPSGRVIRTSTDASDVTSEEGGTFETITVADPEPGDWKVAVIGVDVDPAGEPFSLSNVQIPLSDTPPRAAFRATRGPAKRQVRFDASSSRDDKGIVDYIWDFGDGFAGSGRRVSHEQLSNVVDELARRHQAATLSSIVVGSSQVTFSPSLNSTPSSTSFTSS
ncbi:MAG: VWA domain-containing protein, partial [Actinobacteria bacterium]|nr:VWA domain-containing protein [Actinomycetota bacterium]